jgi:hypothetical protein
MSYTLDLRGILLPNTNPTGGVGIYDGNYENGDWVPSGYIVHSGTGFGAKSSLEPLFYQFFDNADITEGALASTLGFTQGAASVTLTESDGIISGHGCATWTSTSGNADGFPHFYYTLASGQTRTFAMYQYKIERISGTDGSGNAQMKGPRASYGAEYSGTPRSTISFYHNHSCTALSYTNMGLITATVNDGSDDASSFPQTYKSRFRASDFNLVEIDTYFGTVGNSDGFIRPYHNGSVIGPFTNGGFNTDAMPLRATSNELIEYASIFPGLDGITPNDVYRVRVADYYIDNTPQRIVLGNASTWEACTNKIPLIPTAWSNTSVTAAMRAFPGIAAGQPVWSYVVNASGVASAGIERVAI